MVFAMQVLLGTLADDSVMKRETHCIGFQQYSAALPALSRNVARCINNLIKRSDDHRPLPQQHD
jgi:hypothetical protein